MTRNNKSDREGNGGKSVIQRIIDSFRRKQRKVTADNIDGILQELQNEYKRKIQEQADAYTEQTDTDADNTESAAEKTDIADTDTERQTQQMSASDAQESIASSDEEISEEYADTRQSTLFCDYASDSEPESVLDAAREDVTELSLDWGDAFSFESSADNITVESVSDALCSSLSTFGRVDIEYISSVCALDVRAVITALGSAIYQNPDTWQQDLVSGWETAEEYLSGNLLHKLRRTRAENEKYNGHFDRNIEALTRALPESVTSKEIYVTLGSPWVPVDVIDEFIRYIFRTEYYTGTVHDELTGTWEIPNKPKYKNRVASTTTYGTPRLRALDILEKTLNMKTVCVYDEQISQITGKANRIINRAETVIALEKQQKLTDTFRKWVWKDEARRERLEQIYDTKYGCIRRRMFDGSYLEFPTLDPSITLYPYQKNAVARIIFTPNTLLAHEVGSGKTYIMIAAGMEMRRMGLSKKNMYVVPNSIVGQWRDIFLRMYPSANIMVIEPKGFTPEKRRAVLEQVRDRDLDGVIIAYSCFEGIAVSEQYYLDELVEKKKEICKVVSQYSKATKKLTKKKEEMIRKIEEFERGGDTGEVFFDTLGITRLFVDEAHNYKNVPIDTKIDRVLGISNTGSKKCREMLDRVRVVQRQNGGGGVVLATGTPITNSVTDVYVMQTYLQSGELALMELQNFDSWVGMFAEKVTEFEIDVDTQNYRMATRFARFHNLTELTAMLSSIADFHRVDPSSGIPEHDGYRDEIIAKTPAFSDFLSEISERAELVRAGAVSRREDNMLKITTDGRAAALDMRLVSPGQQAGYMSKVARCAENVYYIYEKTKAQKSTQLVFCDSSTPKESFNIYDELRRLLLDLGVEAEQIAYIHDATTEKKREKLFSLVRSGDVRVLIGSTFKLGIGVNVQDRLIALHHLDVPWRPADMTQREGRILRQGNTNERVFIYRYVTEGSFDAYSWQLLETKARFISELLSGTYTARQSADVESTVLSYSEVKALAVGNPLIKARVECANELARYISLRNSARETRLRIEAELSELPLRIARAEESVAKFEQDAVFVAELYEREGTERSEMQALPEQERKAAEAEKKESNKKIRDALFAQVKENVLRDSERTLTSYRGFDIILPANMTEERPFVWLAREGRYYVETGDTESGGLRRIDNYIDSFTKHLEERREQLCILRAREESLRSESVEDYSEQIEACRAKLASIDKKLGVNKK